MAWASGDMSGTLEVFDENAVHTIHVDKSLLPLAGEAKGLPQLVARMEGLRETFEYILFRPMSVQGDDTTVRSRCELIIRDRKTQMQYAGKLRFVAKFRNGKVTRLDEYHDARLLEAFLALANTLHGEEKGTGGEACD